MARDDRDDDQAHPRPRPLMAAARDGATPPTTAGTVLAALAIGVILYRSDAGIDLINLGAGIAAVVATGGTSLYTVLRVLRAAEQHVTPVDDPRSNSGEQLVPRGTALLGEILEQLLELRASPAPPAAEPVEPPERMPTGADFVAAYHSPALEEDPPPRHARTQRMPAVDRSGAARRPPGRPGERAAAAPRRPRSVPPSALPPADPDWYGDEITEADEHRARARPRASSPDAVTAPTGLTARTPSGQIPASALLAGSRTRRRAQPADGGDDPLEAARFGAGATRGGGGHRA